MTMNVGQRYRCQNLDCCREIEVTETSIEADSNPRCCCGAEMKKPYTRPVLKKLDARPKVFDDIRKTRR
jgi:hypothetical protein